MAPLPIIPSELTLPPRTVFRPGAASGLLKEAAPFGGHGIVIHGRSLAGSGILRRILDAAPPALEAISWEHRGGEPTLDDVRRALTDSRTRRVDWVAGIGGGSVIDLAKALAGLLNAPLDPAAYHDGAPIPASRIPFLAVPTTAGTGSEATAVCVLTNAATGVKKSFRHPSLMARCVILDAELLASCPQAVIAASGMDAFTQAFESFTSLGATSVIDALALEAVRQIAVALERVYHDSRSPAAESLLLGSYLAGVALSNARLGVVHGLAHPLGARFHVPHGLACAACLPYAIDFNRPSIGEKYALLSRTVGDDLAAFVRQLMSRVKLVSPFAGKRLMDRDRVIEEILASGSTKSNPRPVGAAEAGDLLDRIFDG